MPTGDRRARRGVVLLEVMIALVILATAGTAFVSMAAESERALVRARTVEKEMRAANAFMNAVALWPREDLDRHLGDRHQGHWIMRVDRPLEELYEVTLSDSSRRHVLIRTSLYRPGAPRATP